MCLTGSSRKNGSKKQFWSLSSDCCFDSVALYININFVPILAKIRSEAHIKQSCYLSCLVELISTVYQRSLNDSQGLQVNSCHGPQVPPSLPRWLVSFHEDLVLAGQKPQRFAALSLHDGCAKWIGICCTWCLFPRPLQAFQICYWKFINFPPCTSETLLEYGGGRVQ